MEYQIANENWTHEQLVQSFKIPENSIVEGCNLVHSNSHAEIEYLRFIHFMNCFPAYGFSGKSFKKIYKHFIEHVHSNKFCVFDNNIVNEQSLYASGFGPKQSESFIQMFQEHYKKNGIELYRVVNSFGINGCGISTCKEFAKKISGITYSFESKTKIVIEHLHQLVDEIDAITCKLESLGYKIILPEEPVKSNKTQVKYMLTGSPKVAGFKTKEVFKQQLNSGEEVGNIKLADILITDDTSSQSSKMKAAKKLGLRILTYSEAIVELNN